MKTQILLPTVLFLSLFGLRVSAGGDRVGNGGDIVHCPDHSEILDFYESTFPAHKLTSIESHEKIADEILTNLARLNPSQADQYRRRGKSMLGQIKFQANAALADIKDAKQILKPKDKACKIEQIAIRRNFAINESSRFIIDEVLWKKLDARNQAGLLLHEIIYEHFYKLGEKDSLKARELVAYLFSDDAFKAKASDYKKILEKMGLPIYL